MPSVLVEINEKYDTGIAIQQLKLRDVNAPPKVRPALSEVEEAKQEAERMKKEALREYNEVIPRARGKAEEMLRAAEGYAIERTNRAKGDAERFIALQKEYTAAPRVTRERLYLEAMDEIMSKTENKVFVDSKASGLLPLLNLNGQGEIIMKQPLLIGVIAAIAIVMNASAFVVTEVEQAIITQFGEPIEDAITEPGLHWKVSIRSKGSSL